MSADLLVTYGQKGGGMVLSAGDVVSVRKGNTPWGKKEGLPQFMRVHVTDANPEELQFLLEPEMSTVHVEPVPICARKRHLDISRIRQLKDTGCCDAAEHVSVTHEFDKETILGLVKEK